MTREQKGEIAIFVGLAAAVAFLIWNERRSALADASVASAPADTTLYGMGTTGSGSVSGVLAGASPQIAFANPGPGAFTYNIGGSTFTVGGSGGCGCNTCGSASSGNGQTFQSAEALAAWLIATGQAQFDVSGGTYKYV